MDREWTENDPIMPVKTSYTKGCFEIEDISGVVGGFLSGIVVIMHHPCRCKMMYTPQGYHQLVPTNFDVLKMEFHFGYLGASDDEAPMTIRRNSAFGVTYCEEAVFTVLNMISETLTEGAGNGFAIRGEYDFHNRYYFKKT